MKEIILTQGQVALVDDEDFEYLNQWKWCAIKSRKTYYTTRTIYIPCKMTVIMHRIIMNTPLDMTVDHIDHNGLNNQKYNLRICTQFENARNVNPHGRSKYLGVFYNGKRFIAKIGVNKKDIHLGSYNTEEDAAKARDIASLKYFGEFANLNFKL